MCANATNANANSNYIYILLLKFVRDHFEIVNPFSTTEQKAHHDITLFTQTHNVYQIKNETRERERKIKCVSAENMHSDASLEITKSIDNPREKNGAS